MVSQEKWDKTKQLIHKMVVMVEQDCLPLARLLQIWGFLMYEGAALDHRQLATIQGD
jgi:hypothetical protein